MGERERASEWVSLTPHPLLKFTTLPLCLSCFSCFFRLHHTHSSCVFFLLPSTCSSPLSSSSLFGAEGWEGEVGGVKEHRSLTHFIFGRKPHTVFYVYAFILSLGRRSYIFSKLETILLRSSKRREKSGRVGEQRRQCKVKGKSAIFYE